MDKRVESNHRTRNKYKTNHMLSLLVTAKQQRGSPSSRGWATTSVVISVPRTPAPRRRSTTGAAALLTIGQLYSHPTTTQCPIRQPDIINLCTCTKTYQLYLKTCLDFCLPSIKLPHCISCISGIFKFYKSKAWRIPGHPNTAKGAVVAK